MTTFRILIADDHELVRHGVRVLLESHPGWEVCGEAVDGRQAVEQERHLNPNAVIIDMQRDCPVAIPLVILPREIIRTLLHQGNVTGRLAEHFACSIFGTSLFSHG